MVLSFFLVGWLALFGYEKCDAFVTSSNGEPLRAGARGGSTQPLHMSTQDHNIVIIGGGIAGLSVAHYLATESNNLKITLLDAEIPDSGSMAAAGVLGLQVRNEQKLLTKMCRRSGEKYSDWVKDVEEGAKNAKNGNGAQFLWGGEWEVGFRLEPGFLSPSDCDFHKGDPPVAYPGFGSGETAEISNEEALKLEPRLNPKWGNWWKYPWHASVDACRLISSLRAACAGAGVQMNFGEQWAVDSLEIRKDRACAGVKLKNGERFPSDTIVVANGAFVNNLLGDDVLKVIPTKGRNLLLKVPDDAAPMEWGLCKPTESYIVPKTDGKILVGGTFELELAETSAQDSLDAAKGLIPSLDDWENAEDGRSLVGVRATTNDANPLLGKTNTVDGVYIVGGLNSFGFLLAPKMGQVIGDLIINEGHADKLSDEDQLYLQEFGPQREVKSDEFVEGHAFP